MSKQLAVLKRFKQRGLTTVEYAIAGALVVLGVVVAFTNLGTAIGAAIQNIIAQL
jgi:pilus assembly protein Flp/PilA